MHVSDCKLHMTGIYQINLFRTLIFVKVPEVFLEYGSKKNITNENNSKIKVIIIWQQILKFYVMPQNFSIFQIFQRLAF